MRPCVRVAHAGSSIRAHHACVGPCTHVHPYVFVRPAQALRRASCVLRLASQRQNQAAAALHSHHTIRPQALHTTPRVSRVYACVGAGGDVSGPHPRCPWGRFAASARQSVRGAVATSIAHACIMLASCLRHACREALAVAGPAFSSRKPACLPFLFFSFFLSFFLFFFFCLSLRAASCPPCVSRSPAFVECQYWHSNNNRPWNPAGRRCARRADAAGDRHIRHAGHAALRQVCACVYCLLACLRTCLAACRATAACPGARPLAFQSVALLHEKSPRLRVSAAAAAAAVF